MDGTPAFEQTKEEIRPLVGATQNVNLIVERLLSMPTLTDAETYLDTVVDLDRPDVQRFAEQYYARRYPEAWNYLQRLGSAAHPAVHDSGRADRKGKSSTRMTSLSDAFSIIELGSRRLGSTAAPATASGGSVAAYPGPRGHASQSGARPDRHPRARQFPLLLLVEDGASRIDESRRPCGCQARIHALIDMCTNCGRIACERELEGPCFFCGNHVGRDLSADLEAHLRKDPRLAKAMAHRDTLLRFDEEIQTRTTILDDEMDYFSLSGSTWSTAGERAQAKHREEEKKELMESERRDRYLAFDTAGNVEVLRGRSHLLRAQPELGAVSTAWDPADLAAAPAGSGTPTAPSTISSREQYVQLARRMRERQSVRFTGEEERQGGTLPAVEAASQPPSADASRARDASAEPQTRGTELSARSCKAVCITQPWASLLVRGIRRVEGCATDSPLRGTLFVVSSSSPAALADLQAAQNIYGRKQLLSALAAANLDMRDVLLDDEHAMANLFPPGRLLGAITLHDCLSRQAYYDRLPASQRPSAKETDAPFVLLLGEASELPPERQSRCIGKKGIYRLPAGAIAAMHSPPGSNA